MHFVSDASELTGTLLNGAYDPLLVGLSYLMASTAAFVALMLIGELRTNSNVGLRGILLTAAAVSLGGGVWSMHFVAMLAFSLPVETTYDVVGTVISLVIPIVVSAVGLSLIRHGVVHWPRLLATGTVLGLSICIMHYSGMAAMRAAVQMAYRIDLFIASVLIAIAAANVALWVGLRFSNAIDQRHWGLKTVSALVMGVAVAGMHYTGMAATYFVDAPGRVVADGFRLDAPLMAFGITATAVIIFCMSMLIAGIDERLSGRHRLGLLVLLMSIIAVGAGGTALVVLYDASFKEQRARVVEIARSQARLIESVARFEAEHGAGRPGGGAFTNTLGQIREAHANLNGFGQTGEYNLGGLRDGDLTYLLTRRHGQPQLTTEASRVAEVPMRRALAQQAGTMVTEDYRGVRVVAAFEPIDVLDLGIVAKMDLAEIRAPFLHASLAAAVGAVALILVGVGISKGIGDPLLRQLEEKERIDVELDFARTVQLELLPPSPPRRERFEFAARMVPARFVGGDFYDFIELGDARLGIIVGDVAGKGVSAALYMARLLGDFRSTAQVTPDPGEVLTKMNDLLCERSSTFASALYMVVDLHDGRVRLANAGHSPALVHRRAGGIEETGVASGPPLGALETQSFSTEELHVGALDTILVYTDGATEPHNADGEEFGLHRLRDIVRASSHAADALVDAIEADIASFTGGLPQFDDYTLVAVRAQA